MRTTLTLDDDVAAQLEQVRRKEHVKLRDLVNDALRRGLQDRRKPAPRLKSYTQSMDLGRCLVDSLDDVEAVIAFAEGENHK